MINSWKDKAAHSKQTQVQSAGEAGGSRDGMREVHQVEGGWVCRGRRQLGGGRVTAE